MRVRCAARGPPTHRPTSLRWSMSAARRASGEALVSGHIVVCHSREDEDYVDHLVSYLRSRGLTVWADDTLEPGTPDWASVIGTVIHSCGALVAVMTESAIASPWVDREVTIAINLRRPVLALSRAG